jgi:isopentenyl diphosphate isomerase/L-lactate dehydrogenase-like FMN-dependent dehydrogenase
MVLSTIQTSRIREYVQQVELQLLLHRRRVAPGYLRQAANAGLD